MTPSGIINQIASFLSTATGFITTFAVLLIGVAVGALMQFDNVYMLAFNLFLSIAAVVIAGVILVSAARSEAAMQVKLDLLIEFSKASNNAIGLEHKDVAEIEAEREAVEKEAIEQLDEHIEEEVEEEVSDQLDERGVGR